jgi:Uma2 family endonuclease
MAFSQPPLNAGDFLSRAEFERRYQAHPEIKKAELVEGIVYIPYPVHYEQHGVPHGSLVAWLGVYQASTPYVAGADSITLHLDLENELQPDALLRLEPAVGGRSQVSADDYLEGPPELIVEVAPSSAAYDLHVKRRVYARNGVPEYLAVQVYEQHLDWFTLREGIYEVLAADESGILRSEIFPGLWLSTEAFWAGDLAAILGVLQEGLASPEHALFAAVLQDRTK